MITVEDAYREIKKHSELPITCLIESREYFCGIADNYYCVRKDAGEVEVLYSFVDYIITIDYGKYVLLKEMFDDYIEYSRRNPSEQSLATVYALAWNRVFYQKESELDMYRNNKERQMIISKWNEIEQSLYADIRKIIDSEDIDYPPCVLNKYDDPFYRIKPFMLRNGWTDNGADKTWVRNKVPCQVVGT